MDSVPQIDQGIESIELIEAEAETLLRRMLITDPNGMLRIEKMLSKLRIEKAVEKHCH